MNFKDEYSVDDGNYWLYLLESVFLNWTENTQEIFLNEFNAAVAGLN